jgi:hypothetical protein
VKNTSGGSGASGLRDGDLAGIGLGGGLGTSLGLVDVSGLGCCVY